MINTTQIAKQSIKYNKSKSILIILAILMSTTLLASTIMLCANWSEENKAQTIKFSREYHGSLRGISFEQFNLIKNNVEIEEAGIVKHLWTKEYEDKSTLNISYLDDIGAKSSNIELINGTFPVKENEVTLDEQLVEKFGYSNIIGEKVKLTYTNNYGEDITRDFILSGITKPLSELADNEKTYVAIVSESYMKKNIDTSKESFNVFFKVKGENSLSGDELKYKVQKINDDLNIIDKSKLKINDDYINILKPNADSLLYGISIGTIVVITSIFVIYNIFYISIVTKVQEFGKLRALGATKKQIKAIIFKEGLFLSIISVPIGILIGYLISDVLLGFTFTVKYPKLKISFFVAFISFMTVFISILKPMKVASRVSIIDAMKYSGSNNSNVKSRKGYLEMDIKKLTEIYLKSHKKRTFVSLISIILSGSIFICMSTILKSIDAEEMARRGFKQDIQLTLDNYTFENTENPQNEFNIIQKDNPLQEVLNKNLQDLEGINGYHEYNKLKIKIKDIASEYEFQSLDSINESNLESLNNYLIKGKIDIENLKTGKEVLISNTNIYESNNIEPGDKIKISIYDGNQIIEKEVKVQAITSGPGDLLMFEEAFNTLTKSSPMFQLGINVSKSNFKEAKLYFKNLDDKNDFIQIQYIDDVISQYEIGLVFTKCIGYSLVVIMGIIGFINLINSMVTSIVTRKKELGILQAMGLTNSQFIRMLNIEAYHYTTRTVIWSIFFGTILGYIGIMFCKNMGMSYVSYNIPLLSIIVLALSIFTSQYILIYFISKNFNKQSLVDRVRYNE